METRAKWTDLIPDTGLRIAEVVDQGDEEYTPGILGLLKKDSDTVAQRNITGKTSLGKIQEFEEGEDIPFVKRYKTYTTKVIYKNYGGSVQVTKNQIEDRDFDAELDEMKDLSRAANYAVDESGAQLFNGGFSTTQKVNGYTMFWYADGVPQFSTVHPSVVPGASTQSNASSTGISLGHDNLQTAKLALNLQQQDNGKALALAGKITLVTPISLEKRAMETVNSDLTPESGNNAMNYFRGSVDVVTSVFFDGANGGSDTQWFVLNTARAKMYHITRQEKVLEMDKDILSKSLTFTIDARWANLSKEWKGTWGSKGDGAAYSS